MCVVLAANCVSDAAHAGMQVVNSVFLRNTAQNGAGVYVQKCALTSSLTQHMWHWPLLRNSKQPGCGSAPLACM